MKLEVLSAAALALSQLCSAYPPLALPGLDARADANPWQPVPAGGVRAPCPGTNTLANHGFINRNGRGITRRAYSNAFVKAFGISVPITLRMMTPAFNLCANVFNNGVQCDTIDLDMLAVPHLGAEHDASLTRDDFKTAWNPNGGDNHSFNQSVWDRSLATLASLGPITHFNLSTANTMRTRRIQQAKVDDAPGWFKGAFAESTTEHAFYLSTMNDPALGQDRMTNPQARIDWVNYWFVNERLPTALGWVKNPTVITNINALGGLVGAASTFPASQPSATTRSAILTSASSVVTASSAVASSTAASSTVATSTVASSTAASLISSSATATDAPASSTSTDSSSIPVMPSGAQISGMM